MRPSLWLTVAASVLSGCASLGTDVAIPDKKAPPAFEGGSAGPSVAETSWKVWLGDEQLKSLVTEALTNNQDLQIALQRVEATRAATLGATGALLPRVSLALGSSMQKFGLYTSVGAGNATTEITPGRMVPVRDVNLSMGLMASWEVDLWGKLRSQRESALAQYLATIEGTNLVLTSLIAEVAKAYFELLALDQVRDILQRSVSRQQQAVEVIRLQKEAGRANELAVQQFEAQLLETQALERVAAHSESELENHLNLLLGRYPKPINRDKNRLLAVPTAGLSTGVPSALLQNRADIREAELRVRASQFDLKAARAAFYPNLTLTAGIGLEAFRPSYLFRVPESLSYSVAGGLLTPLINRRGLEAQFAGAKANQLEALYVYQRTVLAAYIEVVNGLNEIRDSEEILALKKAQKTAVEETVSTADILFRAGKANYLEVLLAQQSVLRADLDLVEASKRRRIADVVLYKALGGGWR
jgi:multidrug efflux system outer membrane protein